MASLSWKRVVPWAKRSEFVQTYLDLYSKNTERQWRAVDTIQLWKCRAHNRLSVAIETSGMLTMANLRYQAALEAGELNDYVRDLEVRVFMGKSIEWFVNHVTEKGQNKAFAQPIHKIAEEFGIPEWLVRLRHESAHGPNPPCLDVLSRGIETALVYLQDVFWSQQVIEADESRGPVKKKRKKSTKNLYNREEIRSLLLNYQKSRYKSLKDGPESEAAREESRTLRRLEHVLNGQQRNKVLGCMIEESHMIPTEQQLRSYHVNIEETLRADPPKVPDVLIQVWKGLLVSVQERKLTSLLLQHMITALIKENPPSHSPSLSCHLLLAWLRLLLLYESANFSNTMEERDSQHAVFASRVEFSKDLLLSTCIQTPTALTCTLHPLVKNTHSGSAYNIQRLEEVEKMFLPDDNEGEMEGREGSQRKDNKRKFVDTGAAAARKRPKFWKRTEPIDWEWVPFGVVPKLDSAEDSGGENHSHSDSSSSNDEEGKSSDDEPDTNTLDPPAEDSREKKSPEKSVDDWVKDICPH